MTTIHETPIGPLWLAAGEHGIFRCGFHPSRRPDPAGGEGWLDLARRELDAYFRGDLRAFTVPVDLSWAPDVDRPALEALHDNVEWGRTISYGALAGLIGLPVSAARDVGVAMARNPVAIIVPCHRVIGTDGSLVGYGGGLPTKRRLLELETGGAEPARTRPLRR